MKNCKSCVLFLCLALAGTSFGSGFGLYEASTKSTILGGAVVGKACDASANFWNPATLSDLTNITLTVGVMTEHPRARMKVDGQSSGPMDPGVFWLPHLQFALPLPVGFTFGLSLMPEYGLGSAYDDDWALRWNTTETTVMSFTLNPNLAYAITEDWSIGAGMKFLYFDFDQRSTPIDGVQQHLNGHNDFLDLSWQLGTRYRILDNLSVGAIYKAKTYTHVDGYSMMTVPYASNGSADTILKLPQSVGLGVNWDITDTVHLGLAATWTEWSTVNVLDFHLGQVHKDVNLRWDDTWRFAIAPSWDFAENWSLLTSYVFETDCCGDQESTMLPPSSRHMISCGLAWRCTSWLELDLGYGIYLMDGNRSYITDSSGVEHSWQAHRALAHSVGFSATFRF